MMVGALVLPLSADAADSAPDTESGFMGLAECAGSWVRELAAEYPEVNVTPYHVDAIS